MRQCALCGKRIERLHIFSWAERAAKLREQRRLIGDRKSEGIDGLNIEPLRLLCKLPAARLRVGQRDLCQPANLSLVFTGCLVFPACCAIQRLQHAHPHLCSGLASEGDGQHLLRLVYHWQQSEIAESEQL